MNETVKNTWVQCLEDCKNSGLSIRQWCSENNVKESSFHYWKRRFGEQTKETVSPTVFAEIPVYPTQSMPQIRSHSEQMISVYYKEMYLKIPNSFQPEILLKVMQVLQQL